MKEDLDKLKICYEEEIDLKEYNTMKINSRGYIMVHPSSIDELKSIFLLVKKHNMKYFVLGNGSNIILHKYYGGIIIKLDKFNKISFENEIINVECGYMLNKLANDISALGYTALEWATGIPGTIGGAIYSNAGAYNKSISDLLIDVIVYHNNKIKTLSLEECNFEYRDSIFKKDKDIIILSCRLKVEKGNIQDIKSLIKYRTKRRIGTQPLNMPSCGSVFRNPHNIPAGKIIENLGFKGFCINDACVSEKHANFIVNKSTATGEDIIKLINIIKETVKKEYNIDLVLELEIIK